MPTPTPVPSVTSTILRQPTAAPATVSASAAQLASLLSRQGSPSRAVTMSHTGTLNQPRLYARTTTPRLPSQVPGEPMPMLAQCAAVMPALAMASSAARQMSATTASAPRSAPVGTLTSATMCCDSSTTPAAILVPPRSMPIRYMCYLLQNTGRAYARPV